MTEREALKLALSVLNEVRSETFRLMRNGQKLYAEEKVWNAIFAIKEALAQPERTWVGLTGWQALDVARSIEIEFKNESDEGLAQQVDDILTFARAIEAALKEKNT